jgi:hypothetical protein
LPSSRQLDQELIDLLRGVLVEEAPNGVHGLNPAIPTWRGGVFNSLCDSMVLQHGLWVVAIT